MKRYKVTIELADGNRIEAKVTARNRHDALHRLQNTEQARQFITSDIVGYTVEPIPVEQVDNNRFVVTDLANRQGWYVCADLDNRVRVEWRKGHYNTMQRVGTMDGATPDPQLLATALREIGDYLAEFFAELL